MNLRLFGRFLHVVLDALLENGVVIRAHRRQRPSTKHDLIEEILIIPVSGRLTIYHRFPLAMLTTPATNQSAPFAWYLGQYIDARTDIFTALGVVCRGC